MDKAGTGALTALKETWSNLSSTQKIVVASVIAISIVIVVIVSTVGMRPSMDTLFSNLQQADAAAIADRLRDMKVNYDLSADGSVIKVPSNQVYDLRLKMATQGLPQGGTVGFEVFNKTNFGMSEFSQKVTYLQALQGELTRTICQFAQVEDARVHLTQPEDKLYTDKQEDAKASVILKLKRGMALGDDQVAGIVRLVASSVEGLKPENVTVTDTNANMLSEATGDSSGLSTRLTATQARFKQEYEQQKQRDIQSMLDRIIGPGKSVVRVSAKMNFDHKETTKEEVLPGGTAGKGVLVSEDTVSESYAGPANKAKGVVSVTQGAQKPPVPANSDYVHTEANNKYEVTRSTEHVVSSPGQVDKLSVAVMLDKAVGGDKVASIRDTVKAAVGIDETKGDVITVSSVAFDRSDEKKEQSEMAAATKTEMMKTVIKDGAAVLLLIIFLLFIRSLFKSIKFQNPAPAEPVAAPAPVVPTMETAGEVINKAYEASPESAKPAEPGPEVYVQDLVKSNPDEVANVVKAWMAEGN